MLVLSRTLGQSVVIDGSTVATLAVIGHRFVALALEKLSGENLGYVTLTADGSAHVAHGVHGLAVQITPVRVRLGFEGPAGINVERYEFFEASP